MCNEMNTTNTIRTDITNSFFLSFVHILYLRNGCEFQFEFVDLLLLLLLFLHSFKRCFFFFSFAQLFFFCSLLFSLSFFSILDLISCCDCFVDDDIVVVFYSLCRGCRCVFSLACSAHFSFLWWISVTHRIGATAWYWNGRLIVVILFAATFFS